MSSSEPTAPAEAPPSPPARRYVDRFIIDNHALVRNEAPMERMERMVKRIAQGVVLGLAISIVADGI